MGVPRLAGWVKKTFPQALKGHPSPTNPHHGSGANTFAEGELTEVCEYVYIDANGPLHNAAQRCFNYGGGRCIIDPLADLTLEERMTATFELLFEKIMAVCEITLPQKVLYIAFDGPAPLAKQTQQRQRRIIPKSEESYSIHGNGCTAADRARDIEAGLEASANTDGIRFSSNALTPGTMFMFRMQQYLNYAIRREFTRNKKWENLTVYFSPPTVPGEGEHKIMEYIRTLPESERDEAKHCMFGPDGDLLMLTLATYTRKMFLLRQDEFNVGMYHLFDMGYIRRHLPKAISITRPTDDVINDFMVEGFFVGNDFLPKIQMFDELEKGIEMMVDTYAPISSSVHLTEGGKLNIPGFYKFVKSLAAREEKELFRIATMTRKRRNHTTRELEVVPEKFEYTNLKKSLSGGRLDFEKYRRLYYTKVFDAETPPFGEEDEIISSSSPSEEKIEEMCYAYVKSFVWVLEYYLHGIVGWHWYYPYHYAPLMTDLARLLRKLAAGDGDSSSPTVFEFDMGEPSLPFEQLASVLPRTSMHLLPSEYRGVVDSPKLQKYYPDPSTVRFDYEGKTQEHEVIVLLPFIDVNRIRKVVRKITPRKRYLRNEFGKVKKFKYTPKRKGYRCLYGKIPRMTCKVKELEG